MDCVRRRWMKSIPLEMHGPQGVARWPPAHACRPSFPAARPRAFRWAGQIADEQPSGGFSGHAAWARATGTVHDRLQGGSPNNALHSAHGPNPETNLEPFNIRARKTRLANDQLGHIESYGYCETGGKRGRGRTHSERAWRSICFPGRRSAWSPRKNAKYEPPVIRSPDPAGFGRNYACFTRGDCRTLGQKNQRKA